MPIADNITALLYNLKTIGDNNKAIADNAKPLSLFVKTKPRNAKAIADNAKPLSLIVKTKPRNAMTLADNINAKPYNAEAFTDFMMAKAISERDNSIFSRSFFCITRMSY